MRKALTYGAVLIGVYLAVYYASGSGTVISTGTKGAVSVIKAFQGRT